MTNPIRVLIVDDHPLFRAGLEQALKLQEDLVVVGISANGQEALHAVAHLRPDVMLLDINLPDINGLQITRQLHQQAHPPSIIILTGHHDEAQLIDSFNMGASAYSSKGVHPETLIKIVRAVQQGYFVTDKGVSMTKAECDTWLKQKVKENKSTIDENGLLNSLSIREMEILTYVTKGYLNKEIAFALKISQQTVKNHVTSILKKLNIKDRTQAAVIALQRGWVRLDSSKEQEA